MTVDGGNTPLHYAARRVIRRKWIAESGRSGSGRPTWMTSSGNRERSSVA